MHLIGIVAASLLLSSLVGCASMNAPSSSLIETIPVVEIGETGDTPENHIVYIPANTSFPVEFSIRGNVFSKNATSTVMVSFKQDMYLYQYWASLDGKTWINSHKLLNVEPSGGFDASGGKVEVDLNLAR